MTGNVEAPEGEVLTYRAGDGPAPPARGGDPAVPGNGGRPAGGGEPFRTGDGDGGDSAR